MWDCTGCPNGPVTGTGTSRPPVDAASEAAVPSPPSTMAIRSVTAPGSARRTPRAMASATSAASSDSLNPLGAMRKRCGTTAGMAYLES